MYLRRKQSAVYYDRLMITLLVMQFLCLVGWYKYQVGGLSLHVIKHALNLNNIY